MRRIVHGRDTYNSIAECMDELGIGRTVLEGLLLEAAAGRKAMIFGEAIYELKDAASNPVTGKRVFGAVPPLLPKLCTHRLGVHHGGGH